MTTVVDSMPPEAPVINPTDGTTIAGTGEPGATIQVDIGDDGTVDLLALVDENGDWTLTPSSPLLDSTEISAVQTDAAGNASPAGLQTVDTVAPDAPTLDLGDGTEVTGTAEANAFIDIDIDNDGTVDATVQANGDGDYTFTPDPQIPSETDVSVTARDAAGNVSTATVETLIVADGIVSGTDGNDNIDTAFMGDLGGDLVDGADGIDDVIRAGAGDDTIISSLGNDDIDAGEGADTITYANINGKTTETVAGGESAGDEDQLNVTVPQNLTLDYGTVSYTHLTLPTICSV